MYQVPARYDGLDNDDDLSIDEVGETESEVTFFNAVYPEIGMHYWVTGSTRLTGSASYFITSDGRDSDFWF